MIKNYTDIYIKILLGSFFTLLVLVSFITNAASEENLTNSSIEELSLDKVFHRTDLIADGKIDKGEFDIYHFSLFKMFDADKNGWIGEDECMTDCFSYATWVGRDIKNANTYKKHEFEKTPYRFDAININKSEGIEVFEYLMFGRDRFSYFDQDQNGTIELDEFCGAYNSSMPCDSTEKGYKNEKNTISD
jgi:Ca2+-binding EF-hand superfamily protein